MPNNKSETVSDGSYISELAALALKGGVPDDLVVPPEEYEQQLQESKQKNSLIPLIDYLVRNPQLQQQLAFFLNYTPSKWLLSQEIPYVVARRNIHQIDASYKTGSDPYTWAKGHNLQGICLSGGGIRSATFNLGVLQGLAKLEMLHEFDYLSSVSGGGYIHQWLAGWIKREGDKTGRDSCDVAPPRDGEPAARDGLRRVQNRLKPLPAGEQLPFQPEPIRWLRRYSNYLTPQKGIFSADIWVAIAIWLRNTLLNQLILVSGLFCLVLIPHGISPLLQKIPACLAGWASLLFFWLAALTIWLALHREYNRTRHLDMYGEEEPVKKKSRKMGGEKTVQMLIIVPLLLSSVLFLIALNGSFDGGWLLIAVLLSLTVMIAGAALAGGTVRTYKINHGMISGHDKKKSVEDRPDILDRIKNLWHWQRLKVFFNAILGTALFNAIFAGIVGTALVFGIGAMLGEPAFNPEADSYWHLPVWCYSTLESPVIWRIQLTIGPPLLLFTVMITIMLAAGLVGRNYPDWLREWLARVRAWSFLFALGWVAYFGITLLGSSIFKCLQMNVFDHFHSIKWMTVLAWIFTTAGSVLAGNSKKSTGTPQDSSFTIKLFAEGGPYVFIVGLLILLSMLADRSFHWAYGSCIAMTALIVMPPAIFLLFGWRVDINEFSMNPFYRNRLTRCYLGATNMQRDPNPLTGFDDRDTRGMQISQLKPNLDDPTKSYSGPLPVICTTINLSFGEDLAWQERKAASFSFSPLYTGYTVGWTSGKANEPLSFNGFVPTNSYFEPDGGINISTAVAISGAAASPNWGYHTNPATAFLLTMFNVRLGWWIFNPRRSQLAGHTSNALLDKPEWPSPRFASVELAKELLGMTNDASKYVYLSDGGHFDNMGLYELVRRRCYRIVICDAEEDERYIFEGIGMAIRKCRIDFGVEITLDKFENLRPDPNTTDSKAHFALGTIRYPETPIGQEGKILYIKSSLTGRIDWPTTDPKQFISLAAEPLDILNYKLQHSSFPHDTTANQWFTESQFESYRRLGEHVAEEIEHCHGWVDFR